MRTGYSETNSSTNKMFAFWSKQIYPPSIVNCYFHHLTTSTDIWLVNFKWSVMTYIGLLDFGWGHFIHFYRVTFPHISLLGWNVIVSLTNRFSGLMSRCTIESECRYAIADVRWPISKRACGSENLEAVAILSNKSPPINIQKLTIWEPFTGRSFHKSNEIFLKCTYR